jgi:hypothetical protein
MFKAVKTSDLSFYKVVKHVTNFTGWLKYSVIRIITEIRHVLSYWLA